MFFNFKYRVRQRAAINSFVLLTITTFIFLKTNKSRERGGGRGRNKKGREGELIKLIYNMYFFIKKNKKNANKKKREEGKNTCEIHTHQYN